jgi:hypothetical protein
MLNQLIGALKPILVTMLVGGAAVVVVAPAVDMAYANQMTQSRAAHRPDATPEPTDENDPDATPAPDYESLFRECLDSRDPDSDACAAAALESGMSYEDFRAKILAKLEPQKTTKDPERTKEPESGATPKPEPTKKPEAVAVKKPEPAKTSFDTLLSNCLESRDESSDACFRAGEASGLSADDWTAKVRAKLDASRQSDFATYFEKCLATRDLSSDYCIRAEELSGLSSQDFAAKFDAKLAAKQSNDFGFWFDRCLWTRDVFSDACAKAQELIGYSDADFQAKFDRYLAERDRTTKATPKPTANSYLTTAMLEECGATHLRASDPCVKALALSAMKPDEFWAKLTAKFGPFN